MDSFRDAGIHRYFLIKSLTLCYIAHYVTCLAYFSYFASVAYVDYVFSAASVAYVICYIAYCIYA